VRNEKARSVEVSANSVDHAVERALEDLQATRDQVEIEVLSEGSRGILGIGGEDARVRVTLTEEVSAAPDAEVTEIALEALRTLLKHMCIQAEVVVQEGAGDDALPVVLDVRGEDLGILIGRQGDTLRDLQYITRLIVSRRLQRWANIVVDVGGYKRRRQSTLTELAQRMAKKAVAEGRPVALEPMPAHERRTVHMALRDSESVRTESTGDGSRRKVVILLKERP
jgi:spoIIIJ-associated protein